MKESQAYLEDLKDIKEIMNRSSKFLSLSGFSGVMAGVYALIGAYLAYPIIYEATSVAGNRSRIESLDLFGTSASLNLLIIASSVLIVSLGTGAILTARKAKRDNENLWNAQSKRLLLNLAIPLVTGGLVTLIMLWHGYYLLLGPITLIFYGLSLVNASKYTLHDIRALGILEILLGLGSLIYLGYGLFFWAVGFGVLHIIYGLVMHFKYGS